MKNFKTVLKEKFSYNVDDIGTYTDQESAEIHEELTLSSHFKDRITIMEEVKGSEKIKLLNVTFDLQTADGCTLVDDGVVVFDDETITTVRVGVQFSLCNENLNGTWAQLLNAIGANRQDREMPLETVITAFVIKKAQKKDQDLIFKGDTTLIDENLNQYDGLLKLWGNDADFVIAPRLNEPITNANAFDNAISVYNNIPEENFDNDVDTEIIMKRTYARAIIEQVWNDKDFNAKIDFTNEGGELSFELPTTDVMVRSYPQMSASDQMFAVPYQFVIYGTDLSNDIDGFFVKYLEDDEKLRFGAKWRSGVAYVFPDKFVRLSEGVS